MKAQFSLTEAEIKDAIKEYVKRHKGVDIKSVYISYYDAGNDPREHSYYTASVSE